MSEEEVLQLFVQIALAIKHTHDRKILHRDLKPGVNKSFFYTTCDFNLQMLSFCLNLCLYLLIHSCLHTLNSLSIFLSIYLSFYLFLDLLALIPLVSLFLISISHFVFSNSPTFSPIEYFLDFKWTCKIGRFRCI